MWLSFVVFCSELWDCTKLFKNNSETLICARKKVSISWIAQVAINNKKMKLSINQSPLNKIK